MASPPKGPVKQLDEAAVPFASDDQLCQWLQDYAPALRRYFMKKVSSVEADDLVQDVFLALQARGAASEIENVEGYLFRTAANVLARRHRRVTWNWDRPGGLEEARDLTDELSPERVLIAREEMEAAIRVLNTLPSRTASAFFMHRFDGMTYEAIGERLGISAKGVEYLIGTAIHRLSKRLGKRR
jgi:RNA polymerase sigma-70 factor (ECF subfamily)